MRWPRSTARHTRPPRTRRTNVRRDSAGPAARLRRAARTPEVAWGALVCAVFVLVCGSVAAWARERPLVAVGRVMSDTAIARAPVRIADSTQTAERREEARQRTPRVYDADTVVLGRIRSSLESLPVTVSGVETVDGVAPEIRDQFRLDADSLAALRAEAADGRPTAAWLERVDRLMIELERTALVDDLTWQRETQEGLSKEVELRVGPDRGRSVSWDRSSVNIRDQARVEEHAEAAARAAGFQGPLAAVVTGRLASRPEPTFQFSAAATTDRQEERAAAVAEVVREVPVGQVIFKRRDVLTADQLDLYREELRAFAASEPAWRLWAKRVAVFGAVSAITGAMAAYVTLYCPRIRRNPARMVGAAGLVGGSVLLTSLSTVADPGLVALAAPAPTVFAAVIFALAYDQRVALALGVLHAVLACIAVDQPIGLFAVMVTGIGTAVWNLRDIRDRRALIGMGLKAALALGLGVVLVALIDRPIVDPQVWQTLRDAGLAASGGVVVGGLTLSILPYLERAFGITTGLTLIELRDPRHPLLRELQQRAPGTYNHSLNVAAIAESAADAVGADTLLTYVGALYHDVGKMNKPDYFVENQSGGPNRHDKLSPAMSLLVIVGHVKDGLELAREFDLPRPIQHFIEAHHGTTLVEYFYHRARRRAEAEEDKGGDAPEPAEVEYRYPGPRPQTKEVAIVMLADAVESATRTMAEPTPARIDAMVRDLANKRLLDGQFDQCELTLKDLAAIVESISRTVASIYHGRIVYPAAEAGG